MPVSGYANLPRPLSLLKAAGASVLIGVLAVPATGFASETVPDAAPAAQPTDLLVLDTDQLRANAQSPAPAVVVATESVEAESAALDPELECMAKVVHHEAANQSRRGQLAVAQLIMNRVRSGRFADTICGVAHQRGQFFDTRRYHPRQDARWETAVEVSRQARDGAAPAVMPGAMFYHAAYQAPTGWFRTRTKLASLGDHIFYR